MTVLLRRLAGPSDLTDAELVRRFRDGRDGDAFAALVRRHGPMVYAVCRRMLPAHHDAEDAFQATFLVLACKPDAVRPPGRVGAWLHGVATRAALKARRSVARRLAVERVAAERAEPPRDIPDVDLTAILDEVLAGLPEKYRLPVVECHLAGRSRKEAAARLGWTEGTLSGRLARALDLLAARLTRRGVGLSAAALAGVLSARPLRANVPGPLTASTVNVAGLVWDGLPVPAGLADTLSRDVMNAMWWTNWKTPALAGLAAGLMLAGAGLSGPSRAAADPPAKADPTAAVTPAAPKTAAGWRATVTIKLDHAVSAVAYGPDVVATGDADGNVLLWDAKTGKEKEKLIDVVAFNLPDRKPTDWLAFNPDGTWLYIVNNDRHGLHACRLDPKDRLFPGFGSPDLRMFGFTPDGNSYLYSHGGKTVEFYPNQFPDNRIASVRQATIKHEDEVTAALVTADSERAFTVTTDGTARCWELGNQNPKQVWSAKTDVANPAAVALAPDGSRLVVAGGDGAVLLLDGKTGKSVGKLGGHAGAVHAAAFGPDGKTLATAAEDKTARVWDAATGKELAVLKGHAAEVKGVGFGPDGKTLVTGSADKTVRVWEFKE